MTTATENAANTGNKAMAVWLVLLAAAGTFSLTMGTRQTMGLFLSPLNTATGLGIGSISLAFAFGQLCWGLTQPFAGAMADKIGAGRVLLTGILLVATGTFITPMMTTTAGLIFSIGILSAGGAGHGGTGSVDGYSKPSDPCTSAWHGDWHHQCGRFFRTVFNGTASGCADAELWLG